MASMRYIIFACIMMNIVGTVIAAAEAAAAEKQLTADCIKTNWSDAWKAKDFDKALNMFMYIELCIEADWDSLSPEQIKHWGVISEKLMKQTFQLYKGNQRFTRVFTNPYKKLQYADNLIKLLQNDLYAVDVSTFLGGQPIADHGQLKKDRIAVLQRIGIL